MVTISILHCQNHYEYLSGNTGGRTTKSTACRHLAAAAVGDGGDGGDDDVDDGSGDGGDDDDTSEIKNLLELIEGRVLLSGAIPLALLGRC